MNAIATGSTLGFMILESCGAPVKNAVRVAIICEADKVALVNVTYVASNADGIVKAIKQFRLEAV